MTNTLGGEENLIGGIHRYEDITSLKLFFRRLERSGVHDFRSYFRRNPDAVLRCVSMIKRHGEKKSKRLRSERMISEHALHFLPLVFRIDSLPVVTEEIICLAEGKESFHCVLALTDYRSAPRFLEMKAKVDPDKNYLLQILASFRNDGDSPKLTSLPGF